MNDIKKSAGKKKKKHSLFIKLFLIYLGMLILTVIVIDVILWGKLSAFEKSEAQEFSFRKKTKTTEAVVADNKNVTASVTPMATFTPTVTPTQTPTPTPTKEPVPNKNIIIKAPEGTKVSIDDEIYTLIAKEDGSNADYSAFNELKECIDNYSEYEGLSDTLELSPIVVLGLSVPGDSNISFTYVSTDGTETACEPEITENENGLQIYTAKYNSNDSEKGSLTERAFAFMVEYALFCAGDRNGSLMTPYFPAKSQYLNRILRMDNAWYSKHTGLPTYSDKTVEEYTGYGDNLVFMKLSMVQSFVSRNTGATVNSDIKLGIWWVKMDGAWMVAGLVY